METSKKILIARIKESFNAVQEENQNLQQTLRQIIRDQDEKNASSRSIFKLIIKNDLGLDLSYLQLNLDILSKNINIIMVEIQKQNFEYHSETILSMLESKISMIIYDANFLKKESENFKSTLLYKNSIGNNSTVVSQDELQKNTRMRESADKSLNSIFSTIIFKLKSLNYDLELLFQTYFYFFNEIESPLINNLGVRVEDSFRNLTHNIKNNSKSLSEDINMRYKDLASQFNIFQNDKEIIEKSYYEIKENFSNIQSRINKYDLTLKDSLEKSNAKIQTELSAMKEKIDNDFKNLSVSLINETNSIKDTHNSFLTLVEKAGVYELTQNYKKKAEDENTEYKEFRKYTTWSIMGAIITTIIVLLIPIFEYWGSNPPVDINYYSLTARMSIALMFFVLAIYLARQATKHYEIYQDNHKTFLQLSALEPFISKMNEDDKLAIRKELVPIYFNKKENIETDKSDLEIDIPKNFHSTIDKLLDIIQAYKK